MTETALARVRAICLSFGDVEERVSHGEPAWFVRGKRLFAMFSTYHHGGSLGVWCAATPMAQAALVASEPKVYFVPPYVGKSGWVGVNLESALDDDELRGVLEEAYQMIEAVTPRPRRTSGSASDTERRRRANPPG